MFDTFNPHPNINRIIQGSIAVFISSRYRDQKCNRGLHCHHPRNCWFYLRDEKTEDVQQLLTAGSITYEERDSEIGEDLYKEYLVHKIRKHGLDPASMHWVSTLRLESILREEGLHIPSVDNLPEELYRLKLRDAISQQLPLHNASTQRRENKHSQAYVAPVHLLPFGKGLIACKVCYVEIDKASIASLPCHDSISCGDCCLNCAKTHFEEKIESEAIVSINCPLTECLMPDEVIHDREKALDFFWTLLNITFPALKIRKELINIYKQKLTEWNLQSHSEFIFCQNNNCGQRLLSVGPQRAACPSCNVPMCSLCLKAWDEQHENMSCEDFAQLKRDNNPKYQQEGTS